MLHICVKLTGKKFLTLDYEELLYKVFFFAIFVLVSTCTCIFIWKFVIMQQNEWFWGYAVCLSICLYKMLELFVSNS